jgi:hypothetical protein
LSISFITMTGTFGIILPSIQFELNRKYFCCFTWKINSEEGITIKRVWFTS